MTALLQLNDNSCAWTYKNEGVAGATVATTKNVIDAKLATYGSQKKLALINLGVNDGIPDETTWKTNYQYIIDAINVKWPDAKIYIAYPWKSGFETQATTQHGWIDDLIAANPGVVFSGHDEAVWLKGSDDGATMTTDGVHYSDAGKAEIVNQWITALGY